MMNAKKTNATVRKRKGVQRAVVPNIDRHHEFVSTVDGGYPAKNPKGGPVVKFFDSTLTSLTPSTSPTITALFGPAQGSAVNQRIGDVAYYKRMYFSYTCNAANADIFSSLRIVIFQWVPNSALVAPTSTDIFQFVSDGIYAMYDWNFSDQYRILYDKIHSFAGLATAPTASTNQCWSGQISLAPAFKKVNFSAGAVTASNLIYVLVCSDSAVIPFPNITFKSRISFEEE